VGVLAGAVVVGVVHLAQRFRKPAH
jgi:hypothetical protein